MDLSNAHVLITGGSRGIGSSLARRMAAKGARVTVVARSEIELKAVAGMVGGHAIVADLTDPGEVDTLIERAEAVGGPIDVLANNAGLETNGPFNAVDPELIRQVARLNLETPMILTRAVLPSMIRRNRGHLYFTSSLAGASGFPGLAPYSATKAGLSAFADTLTIELKRTGIGVTVVAPGPVDTAMWSHLEDADAMKPVVQRLRRLQLIPTAGADQIADVVVNAISNNTPYVGLPRRLFLSHGLRRLPTRITSALLTGVTFGPEPPGSER